MQRGEGKPPVIGAALLVGDLERHHNWIIESQRDLELQDFDVIGVLEDNAWQPIVDKAKLGRTDSTLGGVVLNCRNACESDHSHQKRSP